MGVSSLALAAALAGVQPQCETGVECSAVVVADAEGQVVPDDLQTIPQPGQPEDDAPEPAPIIAIDAVTGRQDDQSTLDPAEKTIVVTGDTPQGDPAQQLNAATFETVQKIDDAVVAPLAKAYDKQVPKPIRSGLRNFLRNLGEPISFINFMLQLKPVRAFKALGRFAINSTIGVAGLFDVASKKPFGLKYEFNGFANTLGYYGVGPGPYLYLPFIGSTTVRDLFGRVIDISIVPAVAGKPFSEPVYALSAGALNSLESRILIDEQISSIREKCGDAYSATRDIYLIGRQLEIDNLRGRQSEEAGELLNRLTVNCDIAVIRAATEQSLTLDQMSETGMPAVAPMVPAEESLPSGRTPETAPADPSIEVPQPANDTEAVQSEPLAEAG